eukprot:c19085_g2_i2.p1 GENE.c19085_g2_i2~~c19085_g2_i2.p1  ORF type:complete len:166 (+),score=28.68 c19085_g2_i2:10-507(+)
MSQHKTWVLDSLSELRVEVPYGARFSLKLLSGAAEIFGAEITNHMIDVSGDNIAVFTYTGCTLEGSGTWTNDYIPSETPPPLHLNIHACLQEIRRDRNHTQGPRVMIIGPVDSGKSTLCRQLINYAIRDHVQPVFVDLDVGQAHVSVPGTISAAVVTHPWTIAVS